MKSVNLKSLIEIYELNNGKFPQAYINFLGSKDYQLTVKQKELCPLISLLKILSGKPHSLHTNLFNYFYVGYEIPQIGKEFDLLRINNCSVLNIEYKREFSEKITNQLKRNQYYLKFLNKEMYLYTYVEKDNTLYTLNSKKELIQTTLDNLANVIELQCEQGNFFENNLNELFDPCNYLISPFRKTPEFLNNEYFLTKEQEEIEHYIKKDISANYKYFVITGDAGSDKTLLTYHLAKDFKVIVLLGEQFYYDDKILKARKMDGIPYSTAKMFFQQITRAINKLEIVVVNNLDVFNKLIEIFD